MEIAPGPFTDLAKGLVLSIVYGKCGRGGKNGGGLTVNPPAIIS
jgi:hypothetical protein